MAHAAPASGTPRTPLSGTPRTAISGAPGTPDIFDERVHATARWAVPVVLGLVYGFWAAAINRDTGPITGWNILFGFVCAFVFAAAWMGVAKTASHLRREVHALLWTAFAGCAFGFIYSQTGASVLRSVFMSLAVAAGVFAVAFYRFYTHEDAQGHRVNAQGRPVSTEGHPAT
ncbi:hypothetical protein ACWKT5_38765 [Streptomyces avermitilis]